MSVRSTERLQPAVILLDSDDDNQAGPALLPGHSHVPQQPRSRLNGRSSSPGERQPQVRVNWRQSRSRRNTGTEDTGDRVGPIIDLTTESPPWDDDVIMVQSLQKSGDRKRRKVSLVVEQPRSPKVPRDDKAAPHCAICLEEMSSMACGPCGHVFCDACLRAAVKAQKRCPTCRKVMQPRSIHRVYLSVQ